MRQYCDGSVSPSKIKMVRRSIVYRKILLLMYHPLVYLQETNGLVVKALRRVVEDALQGPLDDAARSQNTLAQFHQTLTNLQRRHTACVSQLNVTVIYWTPPSHSLSVKRMHKKSPHTLDPNISFLSWMRIHPILQPGTSQRLAKPPQERIGTSLLRDAMDGQLQPGKT